MVGLVLTLLKYVCFLCLLCFFVKDLTSSIGNAKKISNRHFLERHLNTLNLLAHTALFELDRLNFLVLLSSKNNLKFSKTNSLSLSVSVKFGFLSDNVKHFSTDRFFVSAILFFNCADRPNSLKNSKTTKIYPNLSLFGP